MFVWARPPENTLSALALSQQAVSHHILLAPGHLFRPNQEDSPWLRFNVAYSNNDKLFAFLARALSQPAA
ncbi:hypothetical protein [Paludibacterium denitrificans]|uniref:GntR family transcriptional regulator n=1 Tax=Paludibacterium denitrificans TaxID=2675226 RepID=A0A844G7N5_9NEIS|nr:hypothetical protein [Paludibacterium denitrificans]MTD32356.1 hypothetical protein [Paludibacterium denitrificans]